MVLNPCAKPYVYDILLYHLKVDTKRTLCRKIKLEFKISKISSCCLPLLDLQAEDQVYYRAASSDLDPDIRKQALIIYQCVEHSQVEQYWNVEVP